MPRVDSAINMIKTKYPYKSNTIPMNNLDKVIITKHKIPIF